MNIPLFKPSLLYKNNYHKIIQNVISQGILGEGDYVYNFEKKFSKIFGFKNVLAVSSGTAALHLSYMLSNIKKGDDVITSSITAEPTNTTILQSGANPVFADICEFTGNITLDSIKRVFTKKTRAICVVHYGGYPAEIIKIKNFAKKNKVILIEDCAHALGSKYKNNYVGSFGDFAIFSFQAIKHITTIDGGVLVIKNKSIMDRAKKMRWFGLQKGIERSKNRIRELGYKYNMSNVSASLGIHQLKYINYFLNIYVRNGHYYNKQLNKSSIFTPVKILENAKPTFWLYGFFTQYSDYVIRNLKKYNIESSKVHLPNHFHPIFKSSKNKRLNLEKSMIFYKNIVYIPCGWWVNKKNMDYILSKLSEIEKNILLKHK